MGDALFFCHGGCETCYVARMVRLFKGKPICNECYDDIPQSPMRFCDLLPFVPEFQTTIERLTRQRDGLVEALKDVTTRFERCLIASGTSPEFAAVAAQPYLAAIAKAETS